MIDINDKKLEEINYRLGLIECDGSRESMFELTNIIKDLVDVVSSLRGGGK